MMIQKGQYCVRGVPEHLKYVLLYQLTSRASRGRRVGPAAQEPASKSSTPRITDFNAGTSLHGGSSGARVPWIHLTRPGARHVRIHAAWRAPHAQGVTTLWRHQCVPPLIVRKMRYFQYFWPTYDLGLRLVRTTQNLKRGHSIIHLDPTAAILRVYVSRTRATLIFTYT